MTTTQTEHEYTPLHAGMREVTEREFWLAVKWCPFNIHPRIEGKHPYTSTFERQDGSRREWGRIVNEDGEPTKYFLKD